MTVPPLSDQFGTHHAFGSKVPMSAFQQHGGTARFCRGSRNGVHVTFENGWTVSIQWGPGTYSSNHDDWFGQRDTPAPDALTAEVACWRDMPNEKHDHMARWADGDSVQGWRSWEQVQQLLAAAAAGDLVEPIDLWGGDDD